MISATALDRTIVTKPRPPDRFSNLDHLLRHGGSYLIGDTKSIQGVAIASDAEMVYAALMRHPEESLDELHRSTGGSTRWSGR